MLRPDITGWYRVSHTLAHNLPMGMTAEMGLIVGMNSLGLSRHAGGDPIDLSKLPEDAVINTNNGRMSSCAFYYHNDREHLAFTIDYNLATYLTPYPLEKLWKEIRERKFGDIKRKWLVV